VTESVILSDRYRGVHGTLVRIKRRGFSGTKGFVFPLIKLVCSSFMMSSVPHEIAAHEGAVPVPFRHRW
jgi:hypothetical protein